MRITSRIATAGSRGISRFPTLPEGFGDCVLPDGSLDERKARGALNIEGVTWSTGDDRRVMAFAIEFLTQLRNVVDWMNSRPDLDVSISVPKTALEKRCEQRLERGRYSFSRVDINTKGGRIEAKVSWCNPQDLVGDGADKIPGDFSLLCINVLLCISDEIKKRGGYEVRVVEGENCAGYIEQARKINAESDRELAKKKMTEKRTACQNRVGDNCSPICPACPCYRNGKCVLPGEVSK